MIDQWGLQARGKGNFPRILTGEEKGLWAMEWALGVSINHAEVTHHPHFEAHLSQVTYNY